MLTMLNKQSYLCGLGIGMNKVPNADEDKDHII